MLPKTVTLHYFMISLFIFVASARGGPEYAPVTTYLGGSSTDLALAVDADQEGNIYVAGFTESFDFLAHADVQFEHQGGRDAVVVKLSPDGSEVLAFFSLGGPAHDAVFDMKVTGEGNVFLVGDLGNGFMPPDGTCPSQDRIDDVSDVFVARLDNELELQVLHVISGSGTDSGLKIDVSGSHIVSIFGNTTSADLPVTPGAFQTTYQGGGTDYFIARIDMALDQACEDRIVYFTYLGSASREDSIGTHTNAGLVAGPDGLVTVTGVTYGQGSFPHSPGALRSTALGGDDVVITQLLCNPGLPSSEQLRYSTVLGGSANEKPKWVGVTEEGSIQVVGWTWSSTFPRTTTSAHHGQNDIFVTEIDPTALPEEQIKISEFVGGGSYDPPGDCAGRPDGSIVIGGITGGAGFPTTQDALGAINSTDQSYLLDWDNDLDAGSEIRLRYSTALSTGNWCNWDVGFTCNRVWGLAVTADGSVLAAGGVSSVLLGDTENSVQNFLAGGSDMFLYRLDLQFPVAQFSWAPEGDPFSGEICFDASGSTTPAGTTINRYLWDFGDGELDETSEPSTCHSYDQPGKYIVNLSVFNDKDLSVVAREDVVLSCHPGGDVSPWSAIDIGEPAFPGATRLTGDEEEGPYSICAGGKLLLGTSDQFHFVYQEAVEDVVLDANIVDAEGADGRWNVGVMLRESLEPTARHVTMAVRQYSSTTNSTFRAYRREENTTRSSRGVETLPPNSFVRIAREGDTFIALASADGSEGSYVEVHRVTIPDFPRPYFAGLVAAGYDNPLTSYQALSATVTGLRIAPHTPEESRFLRGNTNDDSSTDISDAVFLLTYLFLGGKKPACEKSADIDDNSTLELTDAVYLLNHLFLGGPAPEAPFGECGVDPTPDDLSCETFEGCVDPG